MLDKNNLGRKKDAVQQHASVIAATTIIERETPVNTEENGRLIERHDREEPIV